MQTQNGTEPTVVASDDGFRLIAPEVITPVSEQAAKTAVPMSAEQKVAVEDQVERFMMGLLNEDVQSEAFKARLDSAFALGREEVSVASSLMQGRLLQRNFVGMEDTSAFKAIQDMRGHLDALNPGKQGDLFQPQKLLGFIPKRSIDEAVKDGKTKFWIAVHFKFIFDTEHIVRTIAVWCKHVW